MHSSPTEPSPLHWATTGHKAPPLLTPATPMHSLQVIPILMSTASALMPAAPPPMRRLRRTARATTSSTTAASSSGSLSR